MMDERTNELIQRAVDGDLVPAEMATLEKLLAEDPAANHLFRQLTGLAQGVHTLPEAAVPDKLFSTVMRAVRVSEEVALERAGLSRWTRFRIAFTGRPVFPYAAGVLTGALALTGLWVVGANFNNSESQRAGGTLAPFTQSVAGDSFVWPINDASVSGEIRGTRFHGYLKVAIEFAASEAVTFRLGPPSDPSGGILSVTDLHGQPMASYINNGLTVPLPAGSGGLELIVAHSDEDTAARQLQILAGDRVVAQFELGGKFQK